MNKKVIIISLITIFLLSSFSNITLSKTHVDVKITSDILIVDNEGDGDYKKISTAIKNAKPGDTIEVYSGRYKEHLEINKQIILKGIPAELDNGCNSGPPIIDGSNYGDVVLIQSEGCEISGFKVVNSGRKFSMKSGIKIKANNCKVTGNILKNNYMGISSGKQVNCTVINNTVYNDVFGIYMGKTINSNISNNTLFNTGFIVGGPFENVLTNTIKGNLVNNKPIYFFLNETDLFISNIDAGQIFINHCCNLTVENLTIKDTSIGIVVSYSSNLKFRNNTLENIHRGGISLHGDNCQVYNNTFKNCSYGCYLEGGIGFYVHHNNFIKCFKHDQPVISYIKKHQTFMESKNIRYDSNYWDNWIGLKIPCLKFLPKIIPGFRKAWHKDLNIFPIFEFDRYPASEPYFLNSYTNN